MEVIGLIIAGIAGILVGQDAQKRGMNAWGWGIFVFLILIIGLPAYLIARKPKLQPSPEINSYNSSATSSTSLNAEKKDVFCSQCGSSNIAGASFCRKCGHQLS